MVPLRRSRNDLDTAGGSELDSRATDGAGTSPDNNDLARVLWRRCGVWQLEVAWLVETGRSGRDGERKDGRFGEGDVGRNGDGGDAWDGAVALETAVRCLACSETETVTARVMSVSHINISNRLDIRKDSVSLLHMLDILANLVDLASYVGTENVWVVLNVEAGILQAIGSASCGVTILRLTAYLDLPVHWVNGNSVVLDNDLVVTGDRHASIVDLERLLFGCLDPCRLVGVL